METTGEYFYQVTFPNGAMQSFWATLEQVELSRNDVFVYDVEDTEHEHAVMHFQNYFSVIRSDIRNGIAVVKRDGPRLKSASGHDIAPPAFSIQYELATGEKGEIIFKGHEAGKGAVAFARRHFARVEADAEVAGETEH